jgi:peptidoglycan-N-acetylglucosamine deacetylase
VSITYDDTPVAGTRPVLRTFDRYGMSGTFFTVGEQAAANPGLTRAILRHGDELGNHSYTHPNLTTLPDHGYHEYRRTLRTIRSITGFRTCLARPPFGAVDGGVVAAADSLGMTTVMWDQSPLWRDPDPNPKHLAHVALEKVNRGEIIVLHPWKDADRRALHLILRGLLKRGLRSVPVTKLLGGHFVYESNG